MTHRPRPEDVLWSAPALRLDPQAPLLAKELGELALVGPGFVHLRPELAQHPTVARLREGLRADAREGGLPALVPLWGEGAALPGALLEATAAPWWRLASFGVERAVYLKGEPVHGVLLCPGCPLGEAPVVVVMPDGRERAVSVALRRGVGHVELHRLPVGAWRVRVSLPWPDAGSPQVFEARFAVQEGPLAPLWARWVARRVVVASDGSRRLRFAVALGSFDHPAQGRVRMFLEERRTRERVTVYEALWPDAFGVVRGEARLKGLGPLALEWEQEGSLRRSARLECWARAQDEELLPVGALVGDGALREAGVEEPSALGVRLAEGVSRGAPWGLEVRRAGEDEGGARAADDDGLGEAWEVRLRAGAACEAARAWVFEPLSGRGWGAALGPAAPGDEARLRVRDPLAVVLVGAACADLFGGSQPWEGLGVVAPEPAQGPALAWVGEVAPDPEDEGLWCAAGGRAGLRVRLAQPESVGLVAVWRQSERAAPGVAARGLLGGLGRRLLDALRGAQRGMAGREALSSLFEAAGGEEALGRTLRDLLGQPSGAARSLARPSKHPLDEEAEPMQEAPGFSLALLCAVGGEEVLELPPAPEAGRWVAQALEVSRGGAWASSSARLRVGAPVEVEWSLPPFVDQGDWALGRLKVQRWGGRAAALRLRHDGQLVPLTLCPWGLDEEPRPWVEGEALPARAWFEFLARPGRWTLEVGPLEEPAELWARQERWVSEAGRAVWPVRRVRCLVPGDRTLLQGEAERRALRDLTPLLEGLARALVARGGDSCEAAAARLLAAGVGLAEGWDEPGAWFDELLKALARLRALFVPGEGLSAYAPNGPIEPALGEAAMRLLLRAQLVCARLPQDESLAGRARVALEAATHLGQRVAISAGAVLPPPVERLRDGDDADLLLRMRPERVEIAAATARARLKGRASSREEAQRAAQGRAGAAQRRAERAWCARVLLETGDPLDAASALFALGEACAGVSGAPLGHEGGAGVADTAALMLVLFEVARRPEVQSCGELASLDGVPKAWGEPTREALMAQGGHAWVAWDEPEPDDLTEPSSLIPLQVQLQRLGQRAPQTVFYVGEPLELDVDLGTPERGGGAVEGDALEVHLPACLAAVPAPNLSLEREGRLLRLGLDPGARRASLALRAVGLTGAGAEAHRAAQHFAVGLRNARDPKRGRGLVGLDVRVVATEDLAARLRRGVRDLLG